MYIVFYHAFIMRAPCIGVRCWLLLFIGTTLFCVFFYYYRLCWDMLLIRGYYHLLI